MICQPRITTRQIIQMMKSPPTMNTVAIPITIATAMLQILKNSTKTPTPSMTRMNPAKSDSTLVADHHSNAPRTRI